MNNATTQSHIVWLDVIRTVAMLMVIGVHCIDPFYISPTLGSLPEYKHWAAVYGSLLRPSVPLFVMMTGLLLLPIREQSLGVFYKNRHKAQRKAKFYINKCRSASCMQSGWKRTSA